MLRCSMLSGTKLSRAPAWSRSLNGKGPGGCRETSLSRNFPFLRTSQPKAQPKTSVMNTSCGLGLPRASPHPVVGTSHRSRRMHARGQHAAATNEHSFPAHRGQKLGSWQPILRSSSYSGQKSTRRIISGEVQPTKPIPIRVPSTSLAMHCASMVEYDEVWMENHTGGDMASIASSRSSGKCDTGDDESQSHLHAPLPSIPEGQCCSSPGALLENEMRWGSLSQTSTLGSGCPDACTSESAVSLGIDREPVTTFPSPLETANHSCTGQAYDSRTVFTQSSEPIRQVSDTRGQLGSHLQRSWQGDLESAATSNSFLSAAGSYDNLGFHERDRRSAVVPEDSARDPSQAGSLQDVDCTGQRGDGAPRMTQQPNNSIKSHEALDLDVLVLFLLQSTSPEFQLHE